jgi:hypothetical protein
MTVTGAIGRRLGDMAATLWDLLGLADPARSESTTSGDRIGGDGVQVVDPPVIETVDSLPAALVPTPRRSAAVRPAVRRHAAGSMQARYDALVRDMKRVHGVRVVRWRSSTSGCAWQVYYADGSTARLIESPYPRGPMSCAVFLHEIGHHAIGFGTYRPRCLEEYHAWRWSFEAMIAGGFNVTEAVRRRRDEALHHAIRKAVRRGLKRLPVELAPFVPVPDRSRPPLPALLHAAPADDAA